MSLLNLVPPHIIDPFKEVSIMEGENLMLQTSIKGEPTPDIVWMKDEKPIQFSKRTLKSTEEDKFKLEIQACSSLDSGEYAIIASNIGGEIRSQCSVLIKQQPSFDKGLLDTIVHVGQQCQLQVISSGVPEPNLKWSMNGLEIVPSNHFKLETKGHLNTLSIDEATLADDSEISVVATNDAGSVKTTAFLKVYGKSYCGFDNVYTPEIIFKTLLAN